MCICVCACAWVSGSRRYGWQNRKKNVVTRRRPPSRSVVQDRNYRLKLGLCCKGKCICDLLLFIIVIIMLFFLMLKCYVQYSHRNTLVLQICVQSTSIQFCLGSTNISFAAKCLKTWQISEVFQEIWCYCVGDLILWIPPPPPPPTPLTTYEDCVCHSGYDLKKMSCCQKVRGWQLPPIY